MSCNNDYPVIKLIVEKLDVKNLEKERVDYD